MYKTVLCVVAILAATMLPAEAAKRRNATSTSDAYPSSQTAPLTAAECNRSQGSVVTDTGCGTGAACIKDGPNGPSKICLSFSQ